MSLLGVGGMGVPDMRPFPRPHVFDPSVCSFVLRGLLGMKSCVCCECACEEDFGGNPGASKAS